MKLSFSKTKLSQSKNRGSSLVREICILSLTGNPLQAATKRFQPFSQDLDLQASALVCQATAEALSVVAVVEGFGVCDKRRLQRARLVQDVGKWLVRLQKVLGRSGKQSPCCRRPDLLIGLRLQDSSGQLVATSMSASQWYGRLLRCHQRRLWRPAWSGSHLVRIRHVECQMLHRPLWQVVDLAHHRCVRSKVPRQRWAWQTWASDWHHGLIWPILQRSCPAKRDVEHCKCGCDCTAGHCKDPSKPRIWVTSDGVM